MAKVQPSISLPFLGCWAIEATAYDSEVLFQALGRLLPDGTDLYVEGSSIEAEPAALFSAHERFGKYLPKPQILRSTGAVRRFRCEFGDELLSPLGSIAARHSEPELLDSLFVYRNEAVLLEWPEAFFGPIWVALEVGEPRIQSFAQALRAGFRRLEPPGEAG